MHVEQPPWTSHAQQSPLHVLNDTPMDATLWPAAFESQVHFLSVLWFVRFCAVCQVRHTCLQSTPGPKFAHGLAVI